VRVSCQLNCVIPEVSFFCTLGVAGVLETSPIGERRRPGCDLAERSPGQVAVLSRGLFCHLFWGVSFGALQIEIRLQPQHGEFFAHLSQRNEPLVSRGMLTHCWVCRVVCAGVRAGSYVEQSLARPPRWRLVSPSLFGWATPHDKTMVSDRPWGCGVSLGARVSRSLDLRLIKCLANQGLVTLSALWTRLAPIVLERHSEKSWSCLLSPMRAATCLWTSLCSLSSPPCVDLVGCLVM